MDSEKSGSNAARRELYALTTKFGNIGLRTPHAERLRRERKLPRPVLRLFLRQDVFHADRVLIHHFVVPLEIEEARRRRRMPARSERDLVPLLTQEQVGRQ